MAEEPQPKPAGGRVPVCGLCIELAATDDAEQSPSAASENEAQAATPATPDQPAELAVAPVADFRQDADNACEACGEPAGGPRGMLGEVNGHVLHHDCALPWEALA